MCFFVAVFLKFKTAQKPWLKDDQYFHRITRIILKNTLVKRGCGEQKLLQGVKT